MKNFEVCFTEAGRTQVQPCEIPELGPQQLLIETQVSLISPGTERAFFLGLPNTSQQYPQKTGYSNIGQVMAVGADIEGWSIGDRVATRSNHRLTNAVDVDQCLVLPEALNEDHAAFFQLAAIAMQGVRKAQIELGESVAVMGAGLIGLLAAQLAKLSGGLPSISLDRDAGRLAFAKLVDIDATLLVEGDTPAPTLAKLKGLCSQDGADVVIEATGHPDAIPMAFALARPYGRVILLGSTRGETASVDFYHDVHKKGLTVIGAHETARPHVDSYGGWWTMEADQKIALELLAQERLKVAPFITNRFYWQQAPQAYERLKTWDSKTLGMLLEWQG